MDLGDDRFGFARIDGGHTVAEDVAAVNPKYSAENLMYTENCGNCAAAYEMRRRGYDVEAAGRVRMYVSEWVKLFEGFQPITLESRTPVDINSEFDAAVLMWGDGARGTVYGEWSFGGAHFFSFEVVQGKAVFIDSQNGKSGVDYLNEILPETVIYGRIDNLKAGDKIKDACLNKKRGW